MHGWDIRSRLEPSAHVSTESVSLFMETIPRTLRGRGLSNARLPVPVRARFVLTGVAAPGVAAIRQRLERAKADGDLPAHANAADLARYVATVIHGMAVQAAGGVSRDELQRVVETALRAWPA